MREFNHFEIAIRYNKKDKFKIVENPTYGWAADPFLVDYCGEIYLFAEIFLYKSERNGVIAYRKIKRNGDMTPWTISMDKHWHLSYPNVFVNDNKLFMVPESYQLEEVALYELNKIPNEWVKIRSIVINEELCDSTFFTYKDGQKYMFTFEKGGVSPNGIGWLYKINNGIATERIYLSNSLEGTRCGGKVIVENDKYIRVGQNCANGYGSGLIFYEIDSVWPCYREHEIYRIDASDIKPNVKSDRNYTGIHTYNRLGNMEVIDLKYSSSTQEENEASERVRKVFLNKYE